jgi:hypothetical protein
MIRRFGKPDRLGLVFSRLSESANLGEAQGQPGAIEDRRGCVDSEKLVNPIARQRREVVGGQLYDLLVLAPDVMHMLEEGHGEDAEPQVLEPPRDVQRLGAGHERPVQLSEQRMIVRHECPNTSAAMIVVQPLGQSFGLAQELQRHHEFTKLNQHLPQFQADLEGPL